ncbi:MAG TPA: hypothetical protein PLU06_07365 [Candidatus Syntrophosphaera sp.]|nr:hypothetical protein [Candidatus Syntrophosphaera sp.]HRQ68495.1 hypothetical protein [Candidatus Syntrophosphaera sp.]
MMEQDPSGMDAQEEGWGLVDALARPLAEVQALDADAVLAGAGKTGSGVARNTGKMQPPGRRAELIHITKPAWKLKNRIWKSSSNG